MQSLELEVENITPLFIAGADQLNIENEGLRSQSLRGLMRWWFRAIMGSFIAQPSELLKMEGEVFGSTDKKSCIKVITSTRTKPSFINIKRDLVYLWFSLNMQKREGTRRYWYNARSRFSIKLSACSKKSFKLAAGSLWSLIYLGGIGSRSRRGAGNLRVIEARSSEGLDYNFRLNGNLHLKELKEFIEDNLRKIFQEYQNSALKAGRYKKQGSIDFPILSSSKITLISGFNRWENALSQISEKYSNYRKKMKKDERYVFGLPIIFRNLKGKGSLTQKLNDFSHKRLASPLIIGVIDTGLDNNRYALRLIKFYTSIHKDYHNSLKLLKEHLNNFDKELSKELSKEFKLIEEIDVSKIFVNIN